MPWEGNTGEGECIGADPFMPPTNCGRPADILTKSDWASGFGVGHGAFGWGRFRVPVPLFHAPMSPEVGTELPFVWEPVVAIVEVDDTDEVEEMEEEELFRCKFFRGRSIRFSSSGFMELI